MSWVPAESASAGSGAINVALLTGVLMIPLVVATGFLLRDAGDEVRYSVPWPTLRPSFPD